MNINIVIISSVFKYIVLGDVMIELNSQAIIGWLITVCFMFVMALLFNGFKIIRGFFWRGIMGVSVILAADYVLSSYIGVIGINRFTAFVSGVLGIPGVALMYCINYFMF